MHFLMVLFVSFLIAGPVVAADGGKVLSVAFGKGRPPYAFTERDKLRGIEVDLTQEILFRMGYKVQGKAMSPFRIEAEAKHGQMFDVVVGVPRSQDSQGNYYSNPFAIYHNYAISLRSKKLSLKNIGDLTSFKVGAWLNAWKDLGRDFVRDFGPRINGKLPGNYLEYSRQEIQFRALWEREVDVLVMDHYIFGWFMMTMVDVVNTGDEVEVFDIFPNKNESFVVFRDADVRDKFNRELQRLRDSGDYDRIVRIYVGEKIAAVLKNRK